MTAPTSEQCPTYMESLDTTPQLRESQSGSCPKSREFFDGNRAPLKPFFSVNDLREDPSTNAKQKRKKPEKRRGLKLTGQERRNLQDLRILQRNLVYAVGLSLDICVEKVLSQVEFFGQFGAIKKISVNRSSPYSSGQSRNGPTGAAYVTFECNEDASACVAAIDGAVWDGHYIRACFGTTKYCQAFLKGAQCNNPDCLYMHYLVNEGTFTKEEMNSGGGKSQSELFALINFDRSKGPVPGSLAKPPKGPGGGNSRRDLTKLTQDRDWTPGGLSLNSSARKSPPIPSPRRLQMITNGVSSLGITNPPNPGLLVPRLSAESAISQISDDQNSLTGRYRHPHEGESLRETKSATPVIEDLVRDRESIQSMIRRRTSVPEQLVEDPRLTRRGPPPGFEQLKNRFSDNLEIQKEQDLQKRASYEETAINALKTLTQNAEFSPGLLPNAQQFVGNLQSPFVANGDNSILAQSSNLGFSGDLTNNSLLQSLISSSAGLGILHDTNSQQLSGQGSIPIMQNRLSADAIDREVLGMRGLSSPGLQNHNSNFEQIEENNEAFQSILNLQENPQNANFGPESTQNPLNDPAILAFKKSGEPDLVQMGLTGNIQAAGNPLSPFDAPGLWGPDPAMPMTPFLMPVPPVGTPGLGNLQYNDQGPFQMMDPGRAASYLYQDQVSSTTHTLT